MTQAEIPSTRPDPLAQFRVRGFVIGEEEEMALREMLDAQEAISFAYDMDDGGANQHVDLTGDQVAAVLRSFARLGRYILNDMPFAQDALARRRRA